MFDIEKGSLQVLHLYRSDWEEGYPASPTWSPDGKWLDLKSYDIDAKREGLWIIRVDGGEEHYLGNYFNPVWSLDGQAIAIQQVSETGAGVWIANVGAGDLINRCSIK